MKPDRHIAQWNKLQGKYQAKGKSQVSMSKKKPKAICTKVTNIYN